MDLVQMEPQSLPKPHKFNHFIGENYQLALNQSMQNLLDAIHKPISDSSVFTSTFYELMQARVNPPLETIWVYSALAFRSSDSPKDDPLNRFSVAKDLFQSITACSASSSSSKSIVLLAPVIYVLCGILVDLKVKELGFKGEKKLMREIKSLVDVILGYINVCCCQGMNDDGSDSNGLTRPLVDLIRVWIGDQVGGNGVKEGFGLFFPLLGDEIIEWLSVGGCDASELAGVVITEAFLLRLCLEFREGRSRQELWNELRTWAVGSITGFRNFHFFEILVKMLLELTLPVTSLLNSGDEIILRKVLYDAVIVVDYSFFNPERVADLAAKHMKSLAMARLVVTHEAVELMRKDGDHTKAISYINAFSGSHLPSQLIRWVSIEIGMESKSSRPNGSSPKAFLNWLLYMEDQGIRLLDDGLSKWRAKLILDNLKADHEQPGYKTDGEKSGTDIFFIDHKGEEEDRNEEDEKTNESMNATFVAAAHTIQSVDNGGGRKRKEGRGVEKKKRVKFLKYDLNVNSGSSGDKSTFFSKDGSSSGSEVENPLSDEDVDVKQQ